MYTHPLASSFVAALVDGDSAAGSRRPQEGHAGIRLLQSGHERENSLPDAHERLGSRASRPCFPGMCV